MSRGSKLVLVPTRIAYPEYLSWWKARGMEDRAPGPPNVGIFVAHVDFGLILGACVYMTDGPFICIEHASVTHKPELRRMWKPAGGVMLREFRRLAVMVGKLPVAFPMLKSIDKICRENGFVPSGARVLVAPMVSG